MENKILQKLDKIDEKFGLIDQRFDVIDQRFEKMDQRFDKVDQKFEKMDQRFDKVEDEMQSGFAIMKISFDDVYERLDRHEASINGLKDEVADVGDSTTRIENKLDLELAAATSRFQRLEHYCGI